MALAATRSATRCCTLVDSAGVDLVVDVGVSGRGGGWGAMAVVLRTVPDDALAHAGARAAARRRVGHAGIGGISLVARGARDRRAAHHQQANRGPLSRNECKTQALEPKWLRTIIIV